jgi:hypothetical protein
MVVETLGDTEIGTLEGDLNDFKKPVRNLFEKGEYYVDISTSLHPDFYKDLEVRKSIEDCVKNVLRVRILLDKDVDINNTKIPFTKM